ncbi:MAG: glycosyltransferase family 4 protein [Candidatus Omnitrophota bacterium]|nr:glycosyltransferase family 4 protein [Candidatus Omnitrophota bacterium]
MKILIIHNSYYFRGGEDEVVEAEKRMLEAYGHKVIIYIRNNREIERLNFRAKSLFFLKDVFWSKQTYDDIRVLIRREEPDIAHIHNVLFMISPSAYDACYDEQIPLVQTLHNFRFLCPIGIFFRQGKICEQCPSLGKISAVFYKCWKNSFLKSFLLVKVVGSLVQKVILQKKVSAFICLTHFAKERFVQLGVPQEKVFIKPNFLDEDPGADMNKDSYAIYVGALRDYKGIRTLIRAWREIKNAPLLKVVGSGPLEAELKGLSKDLNIEFVGQKHFRETLILIKNASFLILPSECYETFPRVVIEAYACGVPVIVSRLEALKEIVEEGKTGVFFNAGDIGDLALKIDRFIQRPQDLKAMGLHVRRNFEEQYTLSKNMVLLEDIYQKVLK